MSKLTDKRRIALVIRQLAKRSGGAERIFCELANMFSEAGHDVVCLTFEKSMSNPFYTLDSKVERINLFPRYISVTNFILIALKHLLFFVPAVKNRIDWYLNNHFFELQLTDYFRYTKPDLAISLMPPANTAVLAASRATGVPAIPTNHNVPAEDYESRARWSQNPIDRSRRLAFLEYATLIHVLFPSFVEWFPNNLRGKILAIPNYISPKFVFSGNCKRVNIILGVGWLSYSKNYIILLRAWRQIADKYPDWRIKIFGSGKQKRMLNKEIRRLGMEGRFELCGRRSDLSSEYSRASILCHPALFEGFGLSVAEALHFGMPVIAFSDCAGVNEYVKDGYNGLLVDRAEGAGGFAAAIERLIVDEELRVNLGRKGPESVERFSFENYRTTWLEVVDSVMKAN